MVKMKQKKAKDMKTSELIDELNKDLEDDRFEEVQCELDKRSPFKYYDEQISELANKIDELENDFKKHNHLNGKVVKEI